jgi:ubiquinone/menaquinone biosynthesis C-methylase UbiE
MYKKFAQLSDDAWLEVLKKTISNNIVEGVQFPQFPDEAVQILFTSHKWDAALEEAFAFYKIVKQSCSTHGERIGLSTKYLDFGVGWGRIARMFLRDLYEKNIYGLDVTPEILETCKKIMPVGEYSLSEPRGTLPYSDSYFNLATAFSVFSHLSADSGDHWIKELHRVMKPGGIVVVTTLSKSFITLCRDVALNPDSSDWAKMMASYVYSSYPNWRELLADFPGDELLYLSSGGGFDTMAASDYGWAMVSKKYAQKQWGEWFEIVDFIDDPSILAQACITMKRK